MSYQTCVSIIAFAGILPPKLNTIKMKPHCPDDEYWTSDGITSNTLILQGI